MKIRVKTLEELKEEFGEDNVEVDRYGNYTVKGGYNYLCPEMRELTTLDKNWNWDSWMYVEEPEEEEYPLTIMDLIEGEKYIKKGEEIVKHFQYYHSHTQSDRFKLVEKKPEVIETKWYMNNAGAIYNLRAKLDGAVEIKPLDDTFTRWERV